MSKHFQISLVKSVLRIVGGGFGLRKKVIPMAGCFIAAEVVGIVEELFEGK